MNDGRVMRTENAADIASIAIALNKIRDVIKRQRDCSEAKRCCDGVQQRIFYDYPLKLNNEYLKRYSYIGFPPTSITTKCTANEKSVAPVLNSSKSLRRENMDTGYRKSTTLPMQRKIAVISCREDAENEYLIDAPKWEKPCFSNVNKSVAKSTKQRKCTKAEKSVECRKPFARKTSYNALRSMSNLPLEGLEQKIVGAVQSKERLIKEEEDANKYTVKSCRQRNRGYDVNSVRLFMQKKKEEVKQSKQQLTGTKHSNYTKNVLSDGETNDECIFKQRERKTEMHPAMKLTSLSAKTLDLKVNEVSSEKEIRTILDSNNENEKLENNISDDKFNESKQQSDLRKKTTKYEKKDDKTTFSQVSQIEKCCKSDEPIASKSTRNNEFNDRLTWNEKHSDNDVECYALTANKLLSGGTDEINEAVLVSPVVEKVGYNAIKENTLVENKHGINEIEEKLALQNLNEESSSVSDISFTLDTNEVLSEITPESFDLQSYKNGSYVLCEFTASPNLISSNERKRTEIVAQNSYYNPFDGNTTRTLEDSKNLNVTRRIDAKIILDKAIDEISWDEIFDKANKMKDNKNRTFSLSNIHCTTKPMITSLSSDHSKSSPQLVVSKTMESYPLKLKSPTKESISSTSSSSASVSSVINVDNSSKLVDDVDSLSLPSISVSLRNLPKIGAFEAFSPLSPPSSHTSVSERIEQIRRERNLTSSLDSSESHSLSKQRDVMRLTPFFDEELDFEFENNDFIDDDVTDDLSSFKSDNSSVESPLKCNIVPSVRLTSVSFTKYAENEHENEVESEEINDQFIYATVNDIARRICECRDAGVDWKWSTFEDYNSFENNSLKTYKLFLLDLCKQIVEEQLRVENETPKKAKSIPQMIKILRMPKMTSDHNLLSKILNDKVTALLKESQITSQADINRDGILGFWKNSRKRDFVDSILAKELRIEDIDWNDFSNEIDFIEELLSNMVLNHFIDDAIRRVH